MACKIPGADGVETNALPDLVEEVATAAPVLGAHTEFSVSNGNSPRDRPWRISPVTEFGKYAGDETGIRSGNDLSDE